MELRHLIDFNDLTPNDWNMLYNLASDIIKSPSKYASACKGKIMATLFYEPSTRTQLSFQTAMLKLGGSVIGFADPDTSSVSKGESLRDTIKIVSGYADIAVMRNPLEGAAYAASLYSRIPLINAGDGGHLHPTQTMADMFTIAREKGKYENLNIGLCGDLLNGRTVHSLLKAFSRYTNNKFWLISTEELKLPSYFYNILKNSLNNEINEVKTLEECIGAIDVLYMTRIQRERFASREEYERQSGIYILTSEKMKYAKKDMIVLHPLPKVDEIDNDVDDDPRAKYFEQAENGLYIRMALVLMMLESNPVKFKGGYLETDLTTSSHDLCQNPRCIFNHEKYLPNLIINSNDMSKCAYCEKSL